MGLLSFPKHTYGIVRPASPAWIGTITLQSQLTMDLEAVGPAGTTRSCLGLLQSTSVACLAHSLADTVVWMRGMVRRRAGLSSCHR
jgi:hypothetical protein